MSGVGCWVASLLLLLLVLAASVASQTNDQSANEVDDAAINEQAQQMMMMSSIPGVADVDYPVFNDVPATSFVCRDQPFAGYYADVEARCQVFHICQMSGRQDSFLCPNGSLFDQRYFVCNWWFNVNCDQSADLYNLNADLFSDASSSVAVSAHFPAAGTNTASAPSPPVGAQASAAVQPDMAHHTADEAAASDGWPTRFQVVADNQAEVNNQQWSGQLPQFQEPVSNLAPSSSASPQSFADVSPESFARPSYTFEEAPPPTEEVAGVQDANPPSFEAPFEPFQDTRPVVGASSGRYPDEDEEEVRINDNVLTPPPPSPPVSKEMELTWASDVSTPTQDIYNEPHFQIDQMEVFDNTNNNNALSWENIGDTGAGDGQFVNQEPAISVVTDSDQYPAPEELDVPTFLNPSPPTYDTSFAPPAIDSTFGGFPQVPTAIAPSLPPSRQQSYPGEDDVNQFPDIDFRTAPGRAPTARSGFNIDEYARASPQRQRQPQRQQTNAADALVAAESVLTWSTTWPPGKMAAPMATFRTRHQQHNDTKQRLATGKTASNVRFVNSATQRGKMHLFVSGDNPPDTLLQDLATTPPLTRRRPSRVGSSLHLPPPSPAKQNQPIGGGPRFLVVKPVHLPSLRNQHMSDASKYSVYDVFPADTLQEAVHSTTDEKSWKRRQQPPLPGATSAATTHRLGRQQVPLPNHLTSSAK